LLVVVAGLVVATACATASPNLADRFITRGTPAIDLGGPPVAMPGGGGAFKAAAAAARPARGTASGRSTVSMAPSLESTSPRLRRSLAALALAPTSEHYLAVAHAYIAEGVRDRAYDHLVAGLEHDRRNAALHDAVARLWRDWGMHDRALTSSYTALHHAPRSAEARNTLGTILWALELRGPAIRAFADAADLAPDAWYAWHNLCQVALTSGLTRDATAYCQHARRLKQISARRRP